VAILSTGDELVEVGETRGPGKVVNSNIYALAGMVREAGAVPRLCGIVRDRRDETIAAIEKALDADVVISSGGVSVGAFDFVKDALDHLGAETRFWRVAMKPGKPVVFATLRDRLYFGLPGNPVSCLVGFLLFVRPALRRMMGQGSNVFLPTLPVRIAAPLKAAGDRRTYFRVRIAVENGELVAYPMKGQGSGVSTSMVAANGLSYLDLGMTRAEAGSQVPTVIFGPIASAR
jgi:molybdopterin molybdotransferase